MSNVPLARLSKRVVDCNLRLKPRLSPSSASATEVCIYIHISIYIYTLEIYMYIHIHIYICGYACIAAYIHVPYQQTESLLKAAVDCPEDPKAERSEKRSRKTEEPEPEQRDRSRRGSAGPNAEERLGDFFL